MLYISIAFVLGGDFSTKHLANIILLLDHASFVKKLEQIKSPLEYSQTYVLLTGKTQERTLGKSESQLLNEKLPPSLLKIVNRAQAPPHSSH